MNFVFIAALFLFWLILSASLHPVHLATGAFVAVIVVWLSPKEGQQERAFSLWSALGYGPWLFIRVMKSGLHVCKLILHPGLPIDPEMLEHKTPLRSDGELAVLGNSITLTPGTITIEIEPGKLLVHALDKASQQDVVSGALDRKVGGMFRNTKSRDTKPRYTKGGNSKEQNL